MSEYICPTCGYARNPKITDRKNELANVHEKDDIPGNWNCPGCGIDKDGLTELKLNFDG